jgi:methionine aminotransferase
LFLKLLANSRFRYSPTAATYFQLADYSNISTEDDLSFTRNLVASHGISLIPVSPFVHRAKDLTLVRFCFAKSDELLQKAGEVICKM